MLIQAQQQSLQGQGSQERSEEEDRARQHAALLAAKPTRPKRPSSSFMFYSNKMRPVSRLRCYTLPDEMPRAQSGFHPGRKSSTGWLKVPPAVPFCTVVSAGTKVEEALVGILDFRA